MKISNYKLGAIKIIVMLIVFLIVLWTGFLLGKYKFKNKPLNIKVNCDQYKLQNQDILMIFFNQSGGIQEFSIWDSTITNLKAEQAFLENGTTRLFFRKTRKERIYLFFNPDGGVAREKKINIQTEKKTVINYSDGSPASIEKYDKTGKLVDKEVLKKQLGVREHRVPVNNKD